MRKRLIMGILAAIAGLIDFLSDRLVRAQRPAWPHLIGNAVVLVLAVINTFMRQLEKLCDLKMWDEEAGQWRLDEHEFSAAIAIVNATKPANELEAAHAAQMVAVHLLQMKCAARALKYDSDTSSCPGLLTSCRLPDLYINWVYLPSVVSNPHSIPAGALASKPL